MRNADCGMRTRRASVRSRNRRVASTRGSATPHSAFRTPHWSWIPHSALRIPHLSERGVEVMGFPHKPHARETPILSRHFGEADARTLKGWTKRGGYEAWE